MPDTLPDRLYDTDFHAWALEQAEALRRLAAARVNLPLDLEHLAEEVEDLGNNALDVVEAVITQIIAHLLKLEWSPAADPRSHWRTEIQAWRVLTVRRLKRSPSLHCRIDLEELHAGAHLIAAEGLQRAGITRDDLPAECPYTLDQILDPEWWPQSRHGLA